MNVEIISIGDELLIGQVVNTNASWMGAQLNNSGFDVLHSLNSILTLNKSFNSELFDMIINTTLDDANKNKG